MKIDFVDNFLNGCTMYRLVLYFLIILIVAAIIFSFFKFLPFNPINIISSTAILISVCWITNSIFAKLFKAPTNPESPLISALILALIITPFRTYSDVLFLVLASIVAMGSKYVLTINRQHIFNPAALAAVVLTQFHHPASWWVGNQWMVFLVTLGGLLVVRKIKQFSMVFSFLFVALVANLSSVPETILVTPILFFAVVMLTEPQTTPAGHILQILYGLVVGLLYALPVSPEMALVAGNGFFYMIRPKQKILLKLSEKKQIAPDIYDFVWIPDKKLSYLPGQYLEWTLKHAHPDSRGIRRYFTIASSPTEDNLRLGIKFYPNSSSFKKSLVSLEAHKSIVAAGPFGEFTLPKKQHQKLCFMAGGIGITPFRSMIKYLLDKNEKRDIILLFSNRKAADIVYKDIFDSSSKLGIKTVYFLTDQGGVIDSKKIKKEVPDYHNRIFYISGPPGMVNAFAKILKEIGLPRTKIKLDFFLGYAY